MDKVILSALALNDSVVARIKPPIYFGEMGEQKNAEIWDFFKNKNTDINRWFIFGICLYAVFYLISYFYVNIIFVILYGYEIFFNLRTRRSESSNGLSKNARVTRNDTSISISSADNAKTFISSWNLSSRA